ncbi:ABC transporter permease [Paenibacillus mucilaginosus]|uniref:YteP7 n=3 Tax=Paenibacillus mucilaginosus TaxID=61624 RepID=H6NGK6_9BACL|nr:sugar ABC transporter permease [Paenibacillus mucilaginosus]AEI46306.1 YteP7 [Paenibacillus mucilaginosus KNP414]AFC33909.1 YteP7 [Paenibacillus mucilaginosus 3016]AFH66242.1 protein lplB [Paenibacillus mucilaginosus K02]MCG7213579.1 sugar ABC transporter permease [Paenibacillus mucilaginosus]WDM27606.1 sugar ABC transporter permease [Paenibacillus mucilaginosus]
MNQVAAKSNAIAKKRGNESGLFKRMLKNRAIYLMILPGLLFFLIFKYVPMWGLIIAFQDYKPYLGITGSPFVGFEHFERLFSDDMFFTILRNTLLLFGMNLLFYFPVPIILALMLNEVRHAMFKKWVQTLVYVPHFMSWVIIVSITFVMLSMDRGLINEILVMMGFEKINFLLSNEWFRPMYILQVIWREAGWGTIIYLAAMAAIDPGLYEAARMDGAGRFRQIWHITLPSVRSVIMTLLILKIGDVLELGFEHIYLLLNSMNREVAEIFDTYVYTAGLKQGQYSFSTAIGFFKSVVGLMLVMAANWLAKKAGEDGIY